MLRIIFIGGTILIISVICLIAIIMSTSKGAEWSESTWKSDSDE